MKPIMMLQRRVFLNFNKPIFCICGRGLATKAENNNNNSFGDQFLRKETITFKFNGNKFNVQSVIQDTNPNGSPLGTVIALHGSPGSHKDFKYVSPILHEKGVRFIGINFPGYGFTEGNSLLNQDNMERVSFVDALCRKLNLDKNLIFMGHSRGTENALKLAALNPDKTVGIVQANFLGARIHRGIRPVWLLSTLAYLWELGWPRVIMRPVMYQVYHRIVNLRVKTGDEAMWALSSMRAEKLELPTQVKYVEMLNESNVKSVMLYSGKDPLMEPEICTEFSALFKGNKHFSFESHEDEDHIKNAVCGELISGTRSVAVFFKNDGHFMQKHRAQLLADAAETMFRESKKRE